MATIRQRINQEVLGHECAKCKRVLDQATIDEVLRRQRAKNKLNITHAHRAQNQNKRKSRINLNQVIKLRGRGFTYKQIGKLLGFTPTAVFDRIKKAGLKGQV